jgi:hypothetical protein
MSRLVILSVVFLFLLPLSASGAVSVKKPEGVEDPPAQIAASPSRIELEIGTRPANGSIKLFNLGKKPVTITTSVQHWDLDKNNKIRVIGPTPQSLDQWIIINPVNFTIPAGKTQTVRMSIRPNVVPEPGEHRAIIYFDQVMARDVPSNGVVITFRLGIVVYGLAGDLVRSGELTDIRFPRKNGQGLLQFDVKSTGNAGIRINGQYSIWPRAAFPGDDRVPVYQLDNKKEIRETVLAAGRITVLPVLANTSRTLTTPITLPAAAGDYILFVQGSLGEQSFKRKFPFTVKP